jgi:hypothetical protein
MGPRVVWPRFNSTAHNAGLKVSAFSAEMSMATETATANCRKSWPLIPGMKATGTKTDKRTKVIARIGPVISAMAFLQASGTESSGFSSITRSTFSTTTICIIDDDTDSEDERQQGNCIRRVAD